MASVFRRENSSHWYAAFRGADNRRMKVSTKLTDRKKALAFANTLEKAANDSKAGLLTESVARKMIAESYEIGANRSMNFSTAKDWLLNWLDEKKQTRRDGTFIRYKSATLAFVQSLEKRSGLDIKHIDVRDAQKFRKALIATGKRNKSVNMDCKAVSTAFNHAIRMGMIDRNPFHGLDKLDEDISVKKPFTHKQAEKILSLCEGEWKGLCLVAYYTGMRISDITSLTWGNLNLDNDVPHLQFSEIKKQNKHKRDIIIPLSKSLLEYFFSLKHGKAKEFIFAESSKHSTGGNKGLSQIFKRILKKAGIVENLYEKQAKGSAARNISPYGFHSFRHTFKTELANSGVHSDVRDVLTGHARPSVAEAYVHRNVSVLKEAVDQLKAV